MILDSCEYGEGAILEIYDRALNNDSEDITAWQQAMLNRQYILLKNDKNKVKEIRDWFVEQNQFM